MGIGDVPILEALAEMSAEQRATAEVVLEHAKALEVKLIHALRELGAEPPSDIEHHDGAVEVRSMSIIRGDGPLP